MIFIVSWCYGGLAMVVFILFWQGSYPPWWHHTGIITKWSNCCSPESRFSLVDKWWMLKSPENAQKIGIYTPKFKR